MQTQLITPYSMFSFIRTMTVGLGITPNLLSPSERALAGLNSFLFLPPVGTFTLP
jgi:hypothetical protein